MFTQTIKLTIVILFTTAVSFAAGRAVVIEIKPDVVVERELVVLEDIASISGDPETVALLRNASLGYAPAVGNVRSIPLRKIRLVIAAAGVPEGRFVLRAPEFVYIRRAGQMVGREPVLKELEAVIFRALGDRKIEIEFTRLDIPETAEVPLGEITISAPLTNVRNLFAPFSIPVEIRVDSKLIRRFSVNVEIIAFAEVVTTAVDIPPLERIIQGDILLERQRILKPLSEYITDVADVRGIRSSREIRKGEPITKSDYVADIVIRNGDRVRINGFSGRLRLSINGVALASGRIGDRIAVKNLQSNQTLQAKIVDEGIVEVFF